MDAVAASGVLALMGVCDFVGTIGSGWLSDRLDNRWLLFWYYGLRGISLLMLPYSNFSFYGLSLFAVFYGLDWIATVPPTVKTGGPGFRPRTGAAGVRLGVHRPPARRRDRRLGGGRLPRRAGQLPARLRRRRRDVPAGRVRGAGDAAPGGRGASVGGATT